MRNDVHKLDISVTRNLMMDLIINQKDIHIISKNNEKISISKPLSFNYKVNPKNKHSSYTVTSKITLETGTYLGTLTVKTEDGKTYTGTLSYQEE